MRQHLSLKVEKDLSLFVFQTADAFFTGLIKVSVIKTSDKFLFLLSPHFSSTFTCHIKVIFISSICICFQILAIHYSTGEV